MRPFQHCGSIVIRYSPVSRPDRPNSIMMSDPMCLNPAWYRHFSNGNVEVVPPPSSNGRS
jgi:hypothetical protein